MLNDYSPFAPFVGKLERQRKLSSAAKAAIRDLQHSIRVYEPATYLFRDGDEPTHCWIVLSGFACRHKVVANGHRQILSFYLKGDGVELENGVRPSADHNVQALSQVRVAAVTTRAFADLIGESEEISRAVWADTIADASIQREWTANVGRRDARTRIAHLLCELDIRYERAGLHARGDYELQLTQEQMGDATGLTSVHVNRVLGGLKAEGVIVARGRRIEVPDWGRLAGAGDFQIGYLQPSRGGRGQLSA